MRQSQLKKLARPKGAVLGIARCLEDLSTLHNVAVSG